MVPVSILFDAARATRPSQVVGRARRLVPPRVLAAGRPAQVRWRALAAGLGVDDAPQGGPSPPPHETGTFACVGIRREAGDPDLWSAERDGLLVAFHLHAFADLARYAAGERVAEADVFWVEILERWLARYATAGAAGWHPFPLSGRVIAWCAALSAGGWPDGLAEWMMASLARQLLLLRRSVEHDVGGNHVLRNATALVIGGACLGDERALTGGERLLEREVPRQILPDGGHEERSPSYHREVLRDLRASATVLARTGRRAPEWAEHLPRMEAWLAALAAPDGSLPLLNDAWEGPPVPSSPEGVRDLPQTGYLALRGDGLHAVLDCAPLGPAHLPPHVHADALSFTLWADGAPVVSDPGAFIYSGVDRDAFRGTAAHSTVVVDGQDQCVFWGPFRASCLPRVVRGPIERHEAGWLVVSAEHDGYRRLPDAVVHERRFVWHPDAGLVVVDCLRASRPHAVASRLVLGDGQASLIIAALDGEAVEETARVAPYLGTEIGARALVQRGTVTPGEPFGWALLRGPIRARLGLGQLRIDGGGRVADLVLALS